MGYWRNITVDCDICMEWKSFDTIDATRVSEARKILKERGWVYIGGKDYCPTCKENIE